MHRNPAGGKSCNIAWCCRLLKGAAPGRKQVNFYTGELNCIRNSKSFARRCETDHRAEVLAGHFDWSVHHTGMGGVTADQKFYDPERVSKLKGGGWAGGAW